MKKKIFLGILILLCIVASFIFGRQVGLNTKDSKTKTVVREEKVEKHDIKNTLTGSGQVSSKTTEKLELSTSKYFKAMCTEDDDTIRAGDNILEYTNGTYLTAPYDCVIISHNVPDTEDKCTDSNYIEVSNLDTLITTLSINENEINNIAVGQEVEIILTADESKTFTGKVTKIDSVGTYETSGTTFSATVEFENDDTIKLGMSLSCTIILKEEKEVISIPIDAVYENKDGKEYVNRIKNDGTTEEVIIETGIADDNYVQVISDLELNEKVQIVTEVTESTDKSSEKSSFSGLGGGNVPEGFSGGGNMPEGMSFDFSGGKPSGMSGGNK